VERALRVLDAAILVVSAVEGVQPQTRIILRLLRRMGVPTLVFVNKCDRTGADPDAVVEDIPDALPQWSDCSEALADTDERAMAAFVEGRDIPSDVLRSLVARGRVLPAFRGSAITGSGVAALIDGIDGLLPRASERVDDPLDAVVFAIDREGAASVRVRSGTLRLRERIGPDRVTSIDDGHADAIAAGRIGRVRGLRSVRIGDVLGGGRREPSVLPPPTLLAAVAALDPARGADLHAALERLAAQDPLIDLRIQPRTGELLVSLYGEVQKEVLRDTVKEEDGIDVSFGDSTVILRERIARPVRVGATMGEDGNRHLAALELELAPSSTSDVTLTASRDGMPLHLFGTVGAFADAMARYVREALARGGPQGWEVIGTSVVVTRSGYTSPGSGAADFRRLTQELIARALEESGTVLCEPFQRVVVECPDAALAEVLGAIVAAEGGIEDVASGVGRVAVIAEVPSRRLPDLERALPGAARGEGTIDVAFAEWREARG
jgi:ribosomal protection tetracycline resistance protein